MMELASLRLICDQGKVLGVMPPQQARDEAAARGLLLLEVQAKAEPPIWKLVTTLPGRAAPVDKTAPSGGGPESQERGSASKQSTKRPANKEARVKELRLVDKSADHDVATKMNFARGQLEKGRIIQVRVGVGVGVGMGMGMGMGTDKTQGQALQGRSGWRGSMGARRLRVWRPMVERPTSSR